jgi:hypothetical protein
MSILNTLLIFFVIHLLCLEAHSSIKKNDVKTEPLASNAPTYKVFEYLPDDPTFRKVEFGVSSEQLLKFEELKKTYYKPFEKIEELKELKELEEFKELKELPLFKISDSSGKCQFFVFGSFNYLPFETLPDWIVNEITESHQIYVLSEGITHLQSESKRTGSLFSENDRVKDLFTAAYPNVGFDIDTFMHDYIKVAYEYLITNNKSSAANAGADKIKNFVHQLLNIFPTERSKISQGHLLCILEYFDRFFDMTSTIAMQALNSGRDMFLFDIPCNIIDTEINVQKINFIKKGKRDFPNSDIESFILNAYFKDEIKFIDYELRNIFIKPMKSLENYFHEIKQEDAKTYLSNMKSITAQLEQAQFTPLFSQVKIELLDMDKRYDRWAKLLVKQQNDLKKMVCVSNEHLPGFFNCIKKNGYKIEAVTQP